MRGCQQGAATADACQVIQALVGLGPLALLGLLGARLGRLRCAGRGGVELQQHALHHWRCQIPDWAPAAHPYQPSRACIHLRTQRLSFALQGIGLPSTNKDNQLR